MVAVPLASPGTPPGDAPPAQDASDGFFEVYSAPPSVWPHFLLGQVDRPVRVLLVDGDPHLLRVMSQELMADPRTMVVSQSSSVRDARRAIKQHEFDAMLVDLNLDAGEGWALLDYMKTVRPGAEAIAVSDAENVEQVLRAFALGATGFLLRSSWFVSYLQAVLQVVNGGSPIEPTLARRLLQRFHIRPDAAGTALHATAPPLEPLTARETEVLRLVASGCTTAEIAQQLDTSNIAVNTHVRSIYRKFQLRTRAQAVRFASLRGLL